MQNTDQKSRGQRTEDRDQRTDGPPWHFDHTPESIKRAAWQQKVIRWLLRTQPAERVNLIVTGYMEGDERCIELFERADRLRRSENRDQRTEIRERK